MFTVLTLFSDEVEYAVVWVPTLPHHVPYSTSYVNETVSLQVLVECIGEGKTAWTSLQT